MISLLMWLRLMQGMVEKIMGKATVRKRIIGPGDLPNQN